MNPYGRLAMQRWQDSDPPSNPSNAITDPMVFFTALGEQIQAQVDDLTRQIAGDDPAGETYLAKVTRLTSAHTRAEEIVLADLPRIEDAEPVPPQTLSPVDEILTAIHRAAQDPVHDAAQDLT